MRYLILSDIHSNLEALATCLEVGAGKYDRVVCLGDLVGYGPDPNAVTEQTRTLAETVIRGNHDKACTGITDGEDFNTLARVSTFWTRDVLTAEHAGFLRGLPAGPVQMDGFQIVHGSPADEDEYIVGPGQAIPALRETTVQVVFFGHTHHQGGFMLTPDGDYQSIRDLLIVPERRNSEGTESVVSLTLKDGARYLINPGSVGQPRDGDWRAAFAIFDDTTREVEYYRTPYNLFETQRKMEAAGLPEPLILRLAIGR